MAWLPRVKQVHNRGGVRAVAVIAATTIILGTGRAPGFAAWQTPAVSLPIYTYTVSNKYPHDRDAFTQGLQFVDGIFYEGTGLNGRSSIRKTRVETGEVLQIRNVPEQYFGEGITVWY
jgi:glutaminyl-peptide cyclotransferase